MGDLGIYDPADSFLFNRNRLLLGEAVRSVRSKDNLSDAFLGEDGNNWICNSKGICIEYWIIPSSNIAQIGLYKVIVNGSEVKDFPNKNDGKIQLLKQ